MIVEHDLHLAGKHIGERRRAAPVGHVLHVDAGQHLEQFARHVDRGSVAGRRHVELAGIGLGVGDQLGNGLDRQRGMHQHDVGEANDARDRLHLLHEIERQLVVERGVDRIRRRDQQQRVAVRRGAQHLLGGDIGAAARPVLDHEGLPEFLRKPLPHQARRHIRRAAGGVSDHEPHRPRWIGLRMGDARHGRECSRTGGELQELTAWKFLHASSNETRAGGSLRPPGVRAS